MPTLSTLPKKQQTSLLALLTPEQRAIVAFKNSALHNPRHPQSPAESKRLRDVAMAVWAEGCKLVEAHSFHGRYVLLQIPVKFGGGLPSFPGQDHSTEFFSRWDGRMAFVGQPYNDPDGNSREPGEATAFARKHGLNLAVIPPDHPKNPGWWNPGECWFVLYTQRELCTTRDYPGAALYTCSMETHNQYPYGAPVGARALAPEDCWRIWEDPVLTMPCPTCGHPLPCKAAPDPEEPPAL